VQSQVRRLIIAATLLLVAAPQRVHAEPAPEESEAHPTAAWITLGSAYGVFATWMYVAWYRNHKSLASFKWGGDGWIGPETYAGGADKFGHAWATMSLARGGTELLHQWGGYKMSTASIAATALSEALFIGVEVRDGFSFEFSFSDLTGDTLGALAALALSNWPRLDELFDYRVEYFPSPIYRRKVDGSSPCRTGGCSRWNIAEDYSGETYLLAMHLGGIHSLRDWRYGGWSRFVDVAVGFRSRDYKPPPDPITSADPRQELFFGISLNAQGVIDYLTKPCSAGHKIGHGVFEIVNVPFTSLPVIELDRRPSGAVMSGGA
jgi:hypothetical protein